MLNAAEARQKLIEGNRKYLEAVSGGGDISPEIRRKTARDGQQPYAVVITCSDSRVIPESIFSAGIGELFVIRVAGNVLGQHEIGSVEYAADHLGTKLIVLLGHTKCGAVGAALEGHTGRFIESIVRDIRLAIGEEKDEYRASCLNVAHGVETIRRELEIRPEQDPQSPEVVGAIYHVEDGRVEFL